MSFIVRSHALLFFLSLSLLSPALQSATPQPDAKELKRCYTILRLVLQRRASITRLKSPLDKFSEALPESLLTAHDRRSEATRKAANEKLLKALAQDWDEGYAEGGNLRTHISRTEANKIVRHVSNHPVVGYPNLDKYEDCGQGFCFGRAVGVHVEALKDKIHPDAIRKIWVVGEMGTDAFHVAALVKSKKEGWLVLDPNETGAMTVREWYAQYGKRDRRHTASLFVSDARRFSAFSNDFYHPVDLFGADNEDFYNRYFSDYFQEQNPADFK